MIIKLVKLKELPDAFHPGNIEEGFQVDIEVGDNWCKPEIGVRFPVFTWWSTSPVQEIIDEKTFRTFNSIYQWEILQ